MTSCYFFVDFIVINIEMFSIKTFIQKMPKTIAQNIVYLYTL
ncbi:conserved hypothetical protein (plasmid) [Borreliella burgdorferi 64b]|nr:conserved hypothetical protein [Borreliella burgdorferi 64b]ACN24130.1 conserved hypothetical protein [Borreliella burgdorferi 64b]ACN24570.1 conserved hypothetical protein [Borreliella burgdorferi 64b]